MYPAKQAQENPDKPALIMAETGETVSYGELESRSNQLAHLLREYGLHRLDHYAVFMENNARYAEVCSAGERSGLYYTCINSYLKVDELAYIINNCEAKVLITSAAKEEIAQQALADCPNVSLCLVIDGDKNGDREGDAGNSVNYQQALDAFPETPIADECLGRSMLYSSGTTGQPKGVIGPLPETPPIEPLPVAKFLHGLWQYRPGMIYLSPAPLYHSAPLSAVSLTIRSGGTAIIMQRFDPELYLNLIKKYSITHSQLVPTMFSRMLKLPQEVRDRSDLSSLEIAIHAAAPCPVPVKEAMIDWWGPIIHEYYGATEALGFTACDSTEWLAHKGTVGKVKLGVLHILDEEGNEAPPGTPGEIWFKTASEFSYFNNAEATAKARSADGTMSSVGDIGCLDEEGFLYLTDRATFMIISGGVNIYPQETENLLITHPRVADAAVFGVPNEDFGEEVKAVIQAMSGTNPGDEFAQELMDFCRENLSHQKCPRSIDFVDELPRLPTGKLYKKQLRDKYWSQHKP